MESGCISLSEAMVNRKSIRGYRPDPVPQDVLRQIIGLAIESPSASNAQPWELAVLTGKPLEELNRITVDLWERGAPVSPDVAPADLFGDYVRRRKEVGKQVFQLLGIEREDRAARREWNRKALRFFDAPAGVIIYTDASLERSRTDFDLGIMTEALCLAAMCFGLGTCIDQQAISYPEAIRQVTGLAESKRITAAVSIGYPDWEFPANKLESSREPVDVVATWHGF
ncbi:MAG: nitroreductase [Chloroflexi bacterium]|nr:nitroreductase [Chloroflexota bacterium]